MSRSIEIETYYPIRASIWVWRDERCQLYHPTQSSWNRVLRLMRANEWKVMTRVHGQTVSTILPFKKTN